MSRVSTYLNFNGQTEEAFRFYAAAFGSEIAGSITRMGDMPSAPGGPELNEREKAIFQARRLKDNPATLEELAQEYNVSRERIRQIEVRAFEKVQEAVQSAARAKAQEQMRERA